MKNQLEEMAKGLVGTLPYCKHGACDRDAVFGVVVSLVSNVARLQAELSTARRERDAAVADGNHWYAEAQRRRFFYV